MKNIMLPLLILFVFCTHENNVFLPETMNDPVEIIISHHYDIYPATTLMGNAVIYAGDDFLCVVLAGFVDTVTVERGIKLTGCWHEPLPGSATKSYKCIDTITATDDYQIFNLLKQ